MAWWKKVLRLDTREDDDPALKWGTPVHEMLQKGFAGMSENEATRFRSFAERYVVARAAHFAVGKEEAESWECILQAKSIYKKINNTANEFRDKRAEDAAVGETIF